MTAGAVGAFDISGPLPRGVTVLEASAGTGKTYTIAALAARYVAEGTPLEQLLLVTFTRMATGELRERVRERLVRDLAAEPDATRCERLARAVSDFDAATIATTHGFCQEVLSGLGVAGDVERDAVFVEDVTDMADEVVDDLYVRRFHRAEGEPAFSREQAGKIASIAVANPLAPIEPARGRVPDAGRNPATNCRRPRPRSRGGGSPRARARAGLRLTRARLIPTSPVRAPRCRSARPASPSAECRSDPRS